MKHCRKCNQSKDESEFYFDSKRNALTAPCKECRIAKVMEKGDRWKKSNKKRYNDSSAKAKVRRKYGLEWDTLVAMWEAQDKSCAICHRPIAIRSSKKQENLHVDHCHVTTVVRGLLCLTCNTGLGMFGDSKDLLDAAKQYLQFRGTRHGKKVTEISTVIENEETIH